MILFIMMNDLCGGNKCRSLMVLLTVAGGRGFPGPFQVDKLLFHSFVPVNEHAHSFRYLLI